MSTKEPFDKERYLNSCPCGCSKGAQVLLDRIEQYKDSDPEMVKYLQWYLERSWDDQVKGEKFRKERHAHREEGDFNKVIAESLRAMADKIEAPGMHFAVAADLPKLPIFSGDDHVEQYVSHISVTIVAGPLGG